MKKHILVVQGGGLHRVCLAAVFLDRLRPDQGVHRAVLLHRRGRPRTPAGPVRKVPGEGLRSAHDRADDFFWTFQQAQSYYQFALVNYIGFHDRGMLLAGGCGDTNGPPQIGKTGHLERAYAFGRELYPAATDGQTTQKG